MPLDRVQQWLLPAADLFMVLMWSRPPSGTLRTTRVTTATIALGFAVAVAIGIPGLFLLGFAGAGGAPLALIGAVACLLLAVGALTVAVFGVRQRRLLRRPSGGA